eukprot:m.70451 g.70451  ORF g.70451 m.70451 type:complete len:115 (-) comp14163_c1_seq1:96-440(-)
MADAGLTPEQIMFKKKYGRLPPKKKVMKGPLGRVGGGERTFFDSADHAMSKAGISVDNGKVIPNPENISAKPHAKPSGMTKGAVVDEDAPAADESAAAPATDTPAAEPEEKPAQ